MSVLFKDMEMPEDCGKCIVKYFTPCYEEKHLCPLTELPPHGDLIDRDALLNGEGRYFISVCREGIDVAEIQKAPTVIPADKDGET